MNENTPPLTDAQLRDFARDGCLIVRGAVDAATLEMLRGDFAARVDDLLRRAHAIGKVSAPDGDDFSSAASHLICSAPDTYQHLDISLPLDGNLGAGAGLAEVVRR